MATTIGVSWFVATQDRTLRGRVQVQRRTVTVLTGVQESAIGPVDLGNKYISTETVDVATAATAKEAYRALCRGDRWHALPFSQKMHYYHTYNQRNP